jgi:uncharacterized protein (DUF488 family)
MRGLILTIGHSIHTQQRFIELLHQHHITAIVDVRSAPYSRANPQFNREDLKRSLEDIGIAYIFLGNELGGRSDDPSCYEGGQVRYDRLANTEQFRQGLKRIQDDSKKYKLALMCAEKEPLECHRAILVSRHLINLGLNISHVHSDGSLESHSDALARLARILRITNHEIFKSQDEVLSDLYSVQERRIAFTLIPAPTQMNSARRYPSE